MSEAASSFIEDLLDTDEHTRLGCDERGIEGLKAHKFFAGLDWITLQQCHLEAPYKPAVPPLNKKPMFKSYEEMMKSIDAEEAKELIVQEFDWNEKPTPEENQYFENWDFVSPHTLKVEMGIANAIEGYNKNFKIRQILGEDMKDKTIKDGMTRNVHGKKKTSSFNNVFGGGS